METDHLLLITDKTQRLPAVISLLIHVAIQGDENAKESVIGFFAPSIKKIAEKMLSLYKTKDVNDTELLVQSGLHTLFFFIHRHQEEGFCNFLLFALKENMRYTCATGKLL
jgi:hypothetical protein